MSNVDIKAADISGVRDLVRLERGLRDQSSLFREFAKILEANAKRRFQTKRDPDGKRWAAWAPSTFKARAKKGYKQSTDLLLLSGALRDSIRGKSGRNWAWAESSSPYAKYHEQATNPGDGKLPRRGFLMSERGDLGREDQLALERASTRYFDSLLES